MRIRKVDADRPKSMSERLRELRENQDRTFFSQFGFPAESEADIRAEFSETAIDAAEGLFPFETPEATP